MPVMAKRGRPKKTDGGRNGAPLNMWVSKALVKALDTYLAAQRPRPSKTEVVEVAIEDFLRAKGFWPPDPQAKPAPDAE